MNKISIICVVMAFVITIVMGLGILVLVTGAVNPQIITSPGSNCIDMNGNKIVPTPDLCKMSCNAQTDWEHMQAHYDEVCNCCKARGIDYANAGEYQERVYVVNADGSRGEDRTCAYYPEAEGCGSKNTS